MAKVHVLRGQDRVFGFTVNVCGANLPPQYGPWTPFKVIELFHDEPYQGVDVDACLDDISKYGFHLTAAHRPITQQALEGTPSDRLALVFGGGGAAGNAWVIGLVAGLAEAGLDLTEAADVVIGTSSGATAAAQMRSGTPPAELLASILSEPTAGQNRPSASGPPMSKLFERMRAIGAAATSQVDLQSAMGAFGLESDASFEPEASALRRAQVAARLPRPEWPERPMILAALKAQTGELVAFDKNAGVDLADAVIAATALPGMVPTHDINGTRYINGGVRSAENADLAAGFPNVMVLSPFGGPRGPLAADQFEGLRRLPGADLESQVEALRQQGSHVVVITPDEDSQAAMGTNQMDPGTRIPAARAGYAQGKRQAPNLALVHRFGR